MCCCKRKHAQDYLDEEVCCMGDRPVTKYTVRIALKTSSCLLLRITQGYPDEEVHAMLEERCASVLRARRDAAAALIAHTRRFLDGQVGAPGGVRVCVCACVCARVCVYVFVCVCGCVCM